MSKGNANLLVFEYFLFKNIKDSMYVSKIVIIGKYFCVILIKTLFF